MAKKIWHDNMTADEKITIYRIILDILEQVNNSINFNDFVPLVCDRIDFGEDAGDANFCAIIQELIRRGYIRLELTEVDYANGANIPVIDVVRV